MQIEPWHIPVLVMTAVILPPAVYWLLGRGRGNGSDPAGGGSGEGGSDRLTGRGVLRTRTATLAVLTVVLLVLGIGAALLVPEVLNFIAAVATAISAVVSAALTVVSFRAVRGHQAALIGPTTRVPGEEIHGFAPLPSRGRPVTNTAIDALRDEEPG